MIVIFIWTHQKQWQTKQLAAVQLPFLNLFPHTCCLSSDSPYNIHLQVWLCIYGSRDMHACVFMLNALHVSLQLWHPSQLSTMSSELKHETQGRQMGNGETGFYSREGRRERGRGEEGAVGWHFDHMQIPHTGDIGVYVGKQRLLL